MEREELTPEDRAKCDEFMATYEYFDADGLVYEGSNLVIGDQLEIDHAWRGEVLGGETGLVWFVIPAWGAPIFPIDLIDYVSDRIGPNGETMPIFDEPEINPQCGPSVAAAMARTKPRRPFAEVLRDALRRLAPADEHRALLQLAKHGVLDCHKQKTRRHPHPHGGHK
jgi:hypothetical protein